MFLWSRFIHRTTPAFIMFHNLLWRPIVMLTVGVFSSNHGVLYLTRRFQKSVDSSVRLSVHLSVRSFVILIKIGLRNRMVNRPASTL